MVDSPHLPAKRREWSLTKTDLKVHLVSIPKYRNRLVAEVTVRVREPIGKMARELTAVFGKGTRAHHAPVSV